MKTIKTRIANTIRNIRNASTTTEAIVTAVLSLVVLPIAIVCMPFERHHDLDWAAYSGMDVQSEDPIDWTR